MMQAIQDCRTAALGGHLEACDRCGAEIARYHSCRNRHCPKCQTLARERWIEARTAELLPVPYFHLVFTLPHEINALAQGNPSVLYGLLFQAASNTLQTFGRDPKWLGGEIGITMVLHTWGQNLSQHLHVHCVVSSGALSPDGRWIPAKRGFLFPVQALSIVFRGKYLEALKETFEAGKLDFAGET
ncbi:MAG: transposase zinc-binding domain-containing protein, partial [Beggiatoa sp.]|nr:transposase zinc-binding domain-containing protein [Beggiatoa sp.]